MKLWMSGELQADIGSAYGQARKEIESKMNAKISVEDYGTGVRQWAYIATIVNFEGYGEIRRFSKRDKVAEFRLKIEHDKFKAASAEEQKRLILASLIRSIKMMPHLKIKDFDWQALLKDVTAVAAENSWLSQSQDIPGEEVTQELGLTFNALHGETAAPKKIAIDHDDDCAKHVGRRPDHSQFFLTTPFIPATRDDLGCEFIALYLFDSNGHLTDARIDRLGPRAEVEPAHARQLIERRLSELGPIRLGRIEVRPFKVERFNTTFGLIPRPPERQDDTWWVEAHPGNYMAFHPPWDSGEYET